MLRKRIIGVALATVISIMSISSSCFAESRDNARDTGRSMTMKCNAEKIDLSKLPQGVNVRKLENLDELIKYVVGTKAKLSKTKFTITTQPASSVTQPSEKVYGATSSSRTNSRVHSSGGLTSMNIVVDYSYKSGKYVEITKQTSYLSGLTLGMTWNQQGTHGGTVYPETNMYTYGVIGTIQEYLWIPIMGNTVLLTTYSYDSGTCLYIGAP